MWSTARGGVKNPEHGPGIDQGNRRNTRSRMCAARWYLSLLFVALLVLAPAARSTRANGGDADLALVVGIDISNSVDWIEYRLQRRGLAYAIRHPDVLAAIESGNLKTIAVMVVQWSGDKSQIVAIPWTVLNDAASAVRLSTRMANMERLFGGHATHIAGMISYGTRQLSQMPFRARRKVIDISGDGHDNVAKEPGRSRDEAIAAGITINGLAIENEEKDLRFYYRDFVIGGPGAFVMRTQRYEEFGDAMKKKFIREIAPKLLTTKPKRLDAG